jgi:hypothetical protein
MRFALRRILLRFRLSSHDLRIQTGRHHGTPRAQRLCEVHTHTHATMVAVEDLAHFLLECPSYAYIRTQYLDIFRPAWQTRTLAEGIRATFMTKHQLLLAHCLDRMLAHRRAVLAGQHSPDDPAAHHCVERMLGEFPDPSNDPY